MGTLSLQPGNLQLCGTIPAGASGAVNVSATPAALAVLQACALPAVPTARLDWGIVQQADC